MSTYERGEERLPETPDLRGLSCHACGQTMRSVYTLADVGAFCSEACRSGRLAPFTFVSAGQTFVCAWHEGFDKTHAANRGASHGICQSCSESLAGGL